MQYLSKKFCSGFPAKHYDPKMSAPLQSSPRCSALVSLDTGCSARRSLQRTAGSYARAQSVDARRDRLRVVRRQSYERSDRLEQKLPRHPQQSSGKGGGKGGGSGGFGSMKGGTAAQSYIYKWDLLFNYGIVDKPSYIRRGWVGGDLIVQDTLPGGGADAELQSPLTATSPSRRTSRPPLSRTKRAIPIAATARAARLSSWAYFKRRKAWTALAVQLLGRLRAIQLGPVAQRPADSRSSWCRSRWTAATLIRPILTTTPLRLKASRRSNVGNCGVIYGLTASTTI
jgi:hypothetical protein